MGKNRPIVVATLGYIIGIIWGLYLKTNIVFFYALIGIFLMLRKIIPKTKERKFKFISIQKIFRYIKLILDFKSLVIIILFSSISNFIVTSLNNKYEVVYNLPENIEAIAKVVDNGTFKEYKYTYKVKVGKINGNSNCHEIYFYLDVNSKMNVKLKYGDKIYLTGEYKKPSVATNYKGFDYSEYLKTLKIYGTIKPDKINILKENSNNIFGGISNKIFIKIKNIVQENLPEEKANLLLGILVGYKSEIPEEIEENFKESNISHILAVSGLHVSYIILAITQILEKLQGKRNARLVTIFFIVAYMFITNFSPSVVRAGLMGIVAIFASLTYNKNDIWTSISISLLIILISNPYLITSSGVLLSYGGTIGIILFQKSLLGLAEKAESKSKIFKYQKNILFIKIINYIQDTLAVSFAAQLAIAPIMARMFNTISVSFFITNFFVSIIIGPIIILGFIFIISNLLFSKFLKGAFMLTFLRQRHKVHS